MFLIYSCRNYSQSFTETCKTCGFTVRKKSRRRRAGMFALLEIPFNTEKTVWRRCVCSCGHCEERKTLVAHVVSQ